MTINEIAVLLRTSTHTVNKYLNIAPDTVEAKETVKATRHKLAIEHKKQDVEEARRLAKTGMPIERIAKE